MVEEEKPKVEIKEVVKEKRSAEKILKIFSIVLLIISIIALVWIKIVNPEFPLFYVILLGVFIVVMSGLMYFGFAIYRKLQDKPDKTKEYNNNLPKPANLATLRGLAEDCMTNEYFCNHTVGCKNERYVHSGKYNERIYVYETEALYSDDYEKGRVFIIINAHYPEDLKTVLIDPSSTELTKAINSLASAQEEQPDEEIETRKTYNPLTTAYEEVERKHTKKELKIQKEKEGDLE